MNQVQEYLMKLGLTSSQAKALEVLLNGEAWTAKEVSAETGIPHTKIYASLDELCAMGVVTNTLDTPRVYRSLKPANVFSMLLDQQKNRTQSLESTMAEVLSNITTPVKIGEEQDLKSSVWMYHGAPSVLEEIKQEVEATNKTLYAIGGKITFIDAWQYPGLLNSVYEAVVKRGVDKGHIYPSSVSVKDFAPLAGPGGVLSTPTNMHKFKRIAQSKNMHFGRLPDGEIHQDIAIFDKKRLFLCVRDEQGVPDKALKFSDKSMITFMLNYYDTQWEKSEVIDNSWFDELWKMGGVKK